MQLLRIGLKPLGVPDTIRTVTRASLNEMTAAAATNSHAPAQPIAAIGERAFPGDQELTSLLRRAWQEVAWEPIRAVHR
jgi:hypothetical protein